MKREDLDNLILKKPTTGAYLMRAEYYDSCNKVTEALMDYAMSIKLDPKNVYAYSNRAKLYKRMNAKAKADADLAMVKKLEPLYAEKQKQEKARMQSELSDMQKKAAEKFPSSAISKKIKIELYNKNFDEVIKLATKALEIFPKERKNFVSPELANMIEANFYNVRANAYTEKKKYDMALTDLDKALKVCPNFTPTRFGRAKIFKIQGKLDLAKKEEELANLHKEEMRKKIMARMAEQEFEFKSNFMKEGKTK